MKNLFETASQDKYSMFANRIRKVYKHRSKQAKREGVTCFRLYDIDLPEFPFAIDIYTQEETSANNPIHVCAAEYSREHGLDEGEHSLWLEKSRSTISSELGLPATNIHIKVRQITKKRQEQYQRQETKNQRFIISENNLKFWVNLDDYLDTGLFLDHRPTRFRVFQDSLGKKVLNLFAYTGSFSVYAAAGGASRVTTVDLSSRYLDWAKDNFLLNGLSPQWHRFVEASSMEFLGRQDNESYDLIICDPPTFSNSKKMKGSFDVQRDHPNLINACLAKLNPAGKLIFSTNKKRFKLYDNHIKTTKLTDITYQTAGFDFKDKLERRCFIISL